MKLDAQQEQAQNAAISLREKLPLWVSKPRSNAEFSEFLREMGIYEKSDQYICSIIKNYAELAHKFRIKMSDFISYVVKYATNNKIIHLQVESTARATVQKVLIKLVKEKYALYDEVNKSMILFDPSSVEYYFYNFAVMLEKYYTGLEEHIERAYPADKTLMSSNKVTQLEVWHNVEWKHFNESNMKAFADPNRLKVFRFLFPDRSQIVVHPEFMPDLLGTARKKIRHIIGLLKSKDINFINDLIAFINKKMPDLNLDMGRFDYLLKDSISSNTRFWMVLMANLERYFISKPKLVSFYQAACLVHAWTLGMEQHEKQEKVRLENIKKLWQKIVQTPILYQKPDVIDVARSLQLDKVYQDSFNDFIAQSIAEFVKVPKTKPAVYFQNLVLNTKPYFVVNNHLADIFMTQMVIIKEKYRQRYLNDWRAKFKNRSYKGDPLINNTAEYLKDLYHNLSEKDPEFYGMAHDQPNIVATALKGYSNKSKLAEWKRKHFKKGIEAGMTSLDVLLDLRHSDLISEAEAYSPLLRLFPFLKKLLFAINRNDPTRLQKEKKPKKKSSLVKDAMTNVINSQKKPVKKHKKGKAASHVVPKPEKNTALESVQDRKKAIRDKLQEIQKSLFGNKNILDEIQFMEKKWNRTIEQNLTKKEEIKKKNKKFVVGIIQSHIKNMKLNLENVEKIARNIRDDQQFKNIKDRESLEKYIQGYVILTLQKKHS